MTSRPYVGSRCGSASGKVRDKPDVKIFQDKTRPRNWITLRSLSKSQRMPYELSGRTKRQCLNETTIYDVLLLTWRKHACPEK